MAAPLEGPHCTSSGSPSTPRGCRIWLLSAALIAVSGCHLQSVREGRGGALSYHRWLGHHHREDTAPVCTEGTGTVARAIASQAASSSQLAPKARVARYSVSEVGKRGLLCSDLKARSVWKGPRLMTLGTRPTSPPGFP